MSRENRTQYEVEAEQYLEKYNVYRLFQHMTEQLVLEKPNEPLGFLLSLLEKPVSNTKK